MAKRKTGLEGKITVANKNANGEGTIYQVQSGRKKGQFACQITIGHYTNDKPKRKTFFGKTRTEVKGKRDTYLELHGAGIKIEDAKHKTFGEWLTEYFEIYRKINLRESTYENYGIYIDTHITPMLANIYLIDLDTEQIQEIYNKMKESGKAPATIHRVHQIIDQALDHAVTLRLIRWNPDKATVRPKIKKSPARAMTRQAMDKFLDLVDKLPDWWRAAFLMLLGTGLRIGELLAFEREDLNLDEGTIFVQKSLTSTRSGTDQGDPKNEDSRAKVPIPSMVVEALKTHLSSQAAKMLYQGGRTRVKSTKAKFMQIIYQEHPRLDSYPDSPKKCKCPEEDATVLYKTDRRLIYRCEHCGKEWQRFTHHLVFPSLVGTFVSTRNFRRKFYKVLSDAGIEHYKVHELRHTFATRLLEEGEDIRVVQHLLRQAPGSKATWIYTHVTPMIEKRASGKIDNLLRRKKESDT